MTSKEDQIPDGLDVPHSPGSYSNRFQGATFNLMLSVPLGTVTEIPLDENADSIDLISHNMKLMVKRIQDLRHLGIENNGLPLPKICVVGDQSTGKSSLIEGMSEIKVPRSAGTCTRCPMEINLSESDSPWTCRVILMKKYIYDSSVMRDGRRAPRKLLGPWIEQEPEEMLFMTLSDKKDVQDTLKWAQLATLNPGRSYKEYIPGENLETEEEYQVKFSPNVVRLDISAPRFPNLSFYDLPGVINQPEVDDEKYLVSLVENLVKDYIKASNCIVLLTIPMTDDATNSSAAKLVRNAGATERTVGVLTKPDRFQYGEGYEQWADILSGQKFAFGHGYFVVKNNPNPLVDHAHAREEEAEFFSAGAFNYELSKFSDRFGTRNLQAALSKLLLKQIQESLPGIVKQIRQRAEAVEAELLTLPDPPSSNVPYILCDKLNEFNNILQANLSGSGATEDSLLKEWVKIASDFRFALLRTRPTLRLTHANETFQPRLDVVRLGSVATDDGDCEIVHAQISPSKRKQMSGESNSETKRLRIKSAGGSDSPAALKRQNFLTDRFNRFEAAARTFELEEIREMNSNTYTSGVPGLADPQTIERMNRISVDHWKGPLDEFLRATYERMGEFLVEQLEVVFLPYQRTELYKRLDSIIHEFLGSIRKGHEQAAEEAYKVECANPFTIAVSTYRRAQKEALDMFRTGRHIKRVRAFLESYESVNGQRKLDPSKITEADIGEDEFSKEIEIMAAVRAYYEVASDRFVDTACQVSYARLFSKCRDDLRRFIEEKLGIWDGNFSEKCIDLMAEDLPRQHRRRVLKKEQEKLRKAQEWLRIAERVPEAAGEPMTIDP
ncbi:hypothetical protein AJ80_04837 [Polytolypa hystricis UAMH7299]|uniref:GED domain-containing protein n=1 Tax=Polytolypa hystricis (strain UAMH7299) TaxID=1447883 RepID=A0A2B7Y8K1_POLH7|nr:hypothetical protein AJ80_04837 [Polytolypa hystricis UAMH7299]